MVDKILSIESVEIKTMTSEGYLMEITFTWNFNIMIKDHNIKNLCKELRTLPTFNRVII